MGDLLLKETGFPAEKLDQFSIVKQTFMCPWDPPLGSMMNLTKHSTGRHKKLNLEMN